MHRKYFQGWKKSSIIAGFYLLDLFKKNTQTKNPAALQPSTLFFLRVFQQSLLGARFGRRAAQSDLDVPP